MKAFKYLVFSFFLFFPFNVYALQQCTYIVEAYGSQPRTPTSSISAACTAAKQRYSKGYHGNCIVPAGSNQIWMGNLIIGYTSCQEITCPSATSVDLKVSTSSGSYVCTGGCQYKLRACVDVDFEAGMTCTAISTGQDCGTPPPTTTPTTPPVTQDPTNPTDKTEEQTTFENIMNVIGEKLDGIKDAITGGNQNQDGGDTGGSNGGNTGSEVNVNVDMSETNAKIDETNSLIDELTKWLQGEDLGDDIFGDSEPPEKELTPQQFDTNIFSGRPQCPADARLSFNLLGGKTFTKTFEFKDWCDNLEIFGSFILIASYLFGAYIIVSKS
jgi:hypothetical protein